MHDQSGAGELSVAGERLGMRPRVHSHGKFTNQ